MTQAEALREEIQLLKEYPLGRLLDTPGGREAMEIHAERLFKAYKVTTAVARKRDDDKPTSGF